MKKIVFDTPPGYLLLIYTVGIIYLYYYYYDT